MDLRDGVSTTQTLALIRIVSLDSIRVLARRTSDPRFEDHARSKPFGGFRRQKDLEKRMANETSDFLRDVGFHIESFGLEAKVVSPRSMSSSFPGPCPANIVIDGMQHQDINLIRPNDAGEMETYSGTAGAPIEYDSACGVIVIWTKR